MIFAQGAAFMYMLIASIYFLRKKGNRLTKILGYVLLYWFVLTLKDLMLLWTGLDTDTYIDRLSFVIDMSAVPACLFLMRELVQPKWVNLNNIIANLLPFLALIPVYIISPKQIVYDLILLFTSIYVLICVIIIAIKIPKYRNNLKEQYSYTEDIDIFWLWNILGYFILFTIIWIISCAIFNEWVNALYSFGSSILWFSISYFINKQQLGVETSEKSKDKDTNIEGEDVNNISGALINYYNDELYKLFNVRKIYLDPKLSIKDVAEYLNTNKTYLSIYLNSVIKMSFYDYVNDYRNQIAASILKEDINMNLEIVAEKSGFNSLSTFRRSFLKRYGHTPHYFRHHYDEIP